MDVQDDRAIAHCEGVHGDWSAVVELSDTCIAEAFEKVSARARALGSTPGLRPASATATVLPAELGGSSAGDPGNTGLDGTWDMGIDARLAPFLLNDDIAYAKFLHMRERTEQAEAGQDPASQDVGCPCHKTSDVSAGTDVPEENSAHSPIPKTSGASAADACEEHGAHAQPPILKTSGAADAPQESSGHAHPHIFKDAVAAGIQSASSKRPRPVSPCDALGGTEADVGEGRRGGNSSKRARPDGPDPGNS